MQNIEKTNIYQSIYKYLINIIKKKKPYINTEEDILGPHRSPEGFIVVIRKWEMLVKGGKRDCENCG